MFSTVKKKIIFYGFISVSKLFRVSSLSKCVDLTNQKCVVRPKIIDVNSNDLVFYPFKIAVNKCSGSCNTINNPFDKICVAKDVKDLNIRVINLLSGVNETRFVEWHDNCVL